MSKGVPVKLEYYGDGSLKKKIQAYIETKNLEPFVCLMGNQKQEVLKEAYKNSHFLVLASKSEGWPKAVAEAMFFGCIPVATGVSCVPWMLSPPAPEGGAKKIIFAKRGVLIPDLWQRKEKRKKTGSEGSLVGSLNMVGFTAEKITELIKNPEEMRQMSLAGQEWSQEYTLEKFESEIKKLL
jgi:glycosyltransferase involved in cell wall biosynthesis